jgi:hypothetical protein
MASVSRILVAEGKNLDAGKTAHFHWNNTNPTTGVFSLSIWPIVSFQNNPAIDKLPAQAQILNVSQKFVNAIANVQSSEMEVHFDVHNVGSTRIDYKVFMSIID